MVKKFDTIVVTNVNGGLYVKGRRYSLEKKLEVANSYYKLFHQNFSKTIPRGVPPAGAVARYAKVSTFFARNVIDEINLLGDIVDPKTIRKYHESKKNVVKVE